CKREILRIPPYAGKRYAHRMGAIEHFTRSLVCSHDAPSTWMSQAHGPHKRTSSEREDSFGKQEMLKKRDNTRKQCADTAQELGAMGWMMGIEPTTTGATIRGSTTELHPPLQTGTTKTSTGVDDGD